MGLSKVHPIWSNSAVTVMEQRNWEMFDFSQKTEFGRQREPVGSLKAEKHCRQWTGPLVRFLQLWCEQRKLCLGLQCWDWGWNKASQDEGREGYVYICLHDFRCTNVTKQYETGTTWTSYENWKYNQANQVYPHVWIVFCYIVLNWQTWSSQRPSKETISPRPYLDAMMAIWWPQTDVNKSQ